ncbi:hypothetical protein CJP74_01235 [Psittacicella melopsittaci]|uniref:TNase-like domain-containing protein n=1 Tax=Psittacicella melopsittaci TaxID=2028576 RepID=A0A3A1Y8U8_9GAMM|nr:thermonuclease family protein [Psittacicella melopsittaci]RIY33640.1 hypothetical protein CJP74_01235 [Psittacicella melopsittaci]
MSFLSVKKLISLASVGFLAGNFTTFPEAQAAISPDNFDIQTFGGERGGPGGGGDKNPGGSNPGAMPGRPASSNPATRGLDRSDRRSSVYARSAAFNRGVGYNNFALYNNSTVFSVASVVVSFTGSLRTVAKTSNPTSITMRTPVSSLEDASIANNVQVQDNFNSFVAQNQLPSCLVVEVFSSDTISCYFPHLDQTRIVKLYGIQGPANKAYAFQTYCLLRDTLLNKRLVIQSLSTYQEPSIVAVAYWQGLNVNYRLVELGAAQLNAKYADSSNTYRAFELAQLQAQELKIGLWNN